MLQASTPFKSVSTGLPIKASPCGTRRHRLRTHVPTQLIVGHYVYSGLQLEATGLIVIATWPLLHI